MEHGLEFIIGRLEIFGNWIFIFSHILEILEIEFFQFSHILEILEIGFF